MLEAREAKANAPAGLLADQGEGRVARGCTVPNTHNLKRDAGPGRPKGSKNRFPRSLKASVVRVLEAVVSDDPELVAQAILRGLRGKPRESFPFVQLAAHYLDGKPKESIDLNGNLQMPTIINALREAKPTGEPSA